MIFTSLCLQYESQDLIVVGDALKKIILIKHIVLNAIYMMLNTVFVVYDCTAMVCGLTKTIGKDKGNVTIFNSLKKLK